MTTRSLIVAVALGLVALAGCGGDDNDQVGTRDSGDTVDASLVAEWPDTDFDKRSVSLDEIFSGGPPKDGIPAIDKPKFVSVGAVDFLGAPEPVIAVELAGQARAYPLQILIWHEIVNDRLGDVPISVTFCPLCNTAIVFDRRASGQVLDFGTTGRLRNSDLVMYDRQTETWWQQFSGEAIVGELTGTRLQQVPATMVSWSTFRSEHPDGQVLSRETGHNRSYGQNPYVGYDDIDSPPIFPAAGDDDRLEPKERVVYIEDPAGSAAVPLSVLSERKRIPVELGDRRLTVTWRPGVASALDAERLRDGRDVGDVRVIDAEGAPVAFHLPFWFAVAAFDPDVVIVR